MIIYVAHTKRLKSDEYIKSNECIIVALTLAQFVAKLLVFFYLSYLQVTCCGEHIVHEVCVYFDCWCIFWLYCIEMGVIRMFPVKGLDP